MTINERKKGDRGDGCSTGEKDTAGPLLRNEKARLPTASLHKCIGIVGSAGVRNRNATRPFSARGHFSFIYTALFIRKHAANSRNKEFEQNDVSIIPCIFILDNPYEEMENYRATKLFDERSVGGN